MDNNNKEMKGNINDPIETAVPEKPEIKHRKMTAEQAMLEVFELVAPWKKELIESKSKERQ